MSEFSNWLKVRENLKTETLEIKKLLDFQKVPFEENKVNDELFTVLNKAQGYEEKLMEDVKSVVLIDAAEYDKGEIEKKLNEMLDKRREENQNICDNLNTWYVESSNYIKKYETLTQQVSEFCDNIEKYMDWKDKALALLEESIQCIIEKSDYFTRQMKNEVAEMNRKHKIRFNRKIALYVVLILIGVVVQVVLFQKSGINEATKDVPVYWARSIWFLIVILIVLVAQVWLIISLVKTGEKKGFVRNQLEKLISDITLRKVSNDEIARTMKKVLERLEK